MAAPTWVDGTVAHSGVDMPLHAGTTVDLLRGDLLRAQEQSAYDLTVTLHEDDEVYHAFSAPGVWEIITAWHQLPIPVRSAYGGVSLRELEIGLEARLSAGAKATLRIYALEDPISAVDPTTPLPGLVYAEFPYVAGYEVKTDTVTPTSCKRLPGPAVGGDPADDDVWGVWLVMIGSGVAPAPSVAIRGLRIREVAA